MSNSALRSSAVFAIPLFAARAVSILLLPIYTRHLSTADYGILELLDLTLFVYSQLFSLQQSNAVFYYLAKEPGQSSRVLSTALLGTCLLGILSAGMGALAAPAVSQFIFQTPAYSFALRLYFISMALSLLAEAGLTQLRATEKLTAWNVSQLVRIAIQSAITVVLLVEFQRGYFSMLWGSLIGAGAVGLTIAASFYRRSPVVFEPRLFVGMVRYSAPLSAGAIAMLIIHYGDRFFLQRHVSLQAIGIYAVAYKIGMLSYMIHTPFVTYWAKAMYRIDTESDGERLYARVTTYLILALSAGGAMIVTFNRPLLQLLAAPAFQGAAIYIPWITLAYILRSVGDHLRTVFFTEARTTKSTQVTFVGAATCLVAYITLIPLWGVWGAVIATLLAFSVMCGYGFVAAQRVRYCRFEYGRIAKIGASALAAAIPATFVQLPNVWAQWAVSAGFALLMPLTLWLSRFLTPDERDAVRGWRVRLTGAARRRSAVTGA